MIQLSNKMKFIATLLAAAYALDPTQGEEVEGPTTIIGFKFDGEEIGLMWEALSSDDKSEIKAGLFDYIQELSE